MEKVREAITGIVEQGVVNVFREMFGQDIRSAVLDRPPVRGGGFVHTRLSLGQKGFQTAFMFSFEYSLLMLAAGGFYSGEALGAPVPVFEDVACEITNIVCSKVKSYLNDRGYDIEMGFPFVNREAEGEAAEGAAIHLVFSYDSGKGRDRTGVAVDFTVLNA